MPVDQSGTSHLVPSWEHSHLGLGSCPRHPLRLLHLVLTARRRSRSPVRLGRLSCLLSFNCGCPAGFAAEWWAVHRRRAQEPWDVERLSQSHSVLTYDVLRPRRSRSSRSRPGIRTFSSMPTATVSSKASTKGTGQPRGLSFSGAASKDRPRRALPTEPFPRINPFRELVRVEALFSPNLDPVELSWPVKTSPRPLTHKAARRAGRCGRADCPLCASPADAAAGSAGCRRGGHHSGTRRFITAGRSTRPPYLPSRNRR